MSDPAIEAARRTLAAWGESETETESAATALTAAREALAPIRELHKPAMDTRTELHPEPGCECGNGADWRDCPTARLCYTTEELQ